MILYLFTYVIKLKVRSSLFLTSSRAVFV